MLSDSCIANFPFFKYDIMFWGFLAESCRGRETVYVKKIRKRNCSVHTLILITLIIRLHDFHLGEQEMHYH